MVQTETAVFVGSGQIVFGVGATEEIGDHAANLGLHRVLVVTDPRIAELGIADQVLASLSRAGIKASLWDGVTVEPTASSFQRAARVAAEGNYDGFVGVGGGSSIDTAKAADLYSTYPADFLDYVNPPIGLGKAPPGPLRPLIAVPTTAGTGSESTGVAIFDLPDLRAKTGIAHPRLRPTLGIVDPAHLRTVPGTVAAAAGFDVLCHALESYTALPYTQRPAPPSPSRRPTYQGSNPFSDIWAERAMQLVAEYLPRFVRDRTDEQACQAMAFAATCAGMGFGTGGVHLAHGMSYAVSSQVREFFAHGYPTDHAFVPHGMAVGLCAPAVFRWTAQVTPERHFRAAQLIGAVIADDGPGGAGNFIAGRIIELLRETGMPNGLTEVGYTMDDVGQLVAATVPQHRVISLSPRPASSADLEELFKDALQYW